MDVFVINYSKSWCKISDNKMKHEIITLADVQIIGMAKEIAFCKGQEECPRF